MLRRSNLSSGNRARTGVDVLDTTELHLVGQAILEHLHQESNYLDSVIACSSRMSDLLKESSFSNSGPVDHAPANSDAAVSVASIQRMKSDLAIRFEPIAAGRKQVNSVLERLEANSANGPSLRELAARLEGPLRDELNRLRHEIRQKLQEVQTITLGNQAVLLYTLDFYHRMMAGITGEIPSAHSYNANGQMLQSPAGHLVEKQC